VPHSDSYVSVYSIQYMFEQVYYSNPVWL